MNNNSFIERYIGIPDNKVARNIIIAAIALTNIIIFGIMYYYYNIVLNSSVPQYLLKPYIIIILAIDLFSLVFYIFVNKMKKIIHLYTAVFFTVSSISFFYFGIKIIVNEMDIDMAYLTFSLCMLIYIAIIIAVIFNIKNKIENNFKRKPLNNTLIGAICSLGAFVGIFLGKHTASNNNVFGIVVLFLSYTLIPAISGFHKFYLIIKKSKF